MRRFPPAFFFDQLAQALGKWGRPQDEFVDIEILKSEPDIKYLLNDVKRIFHDLDEVNLAVEDQIAVVNCPGHILL